MNFTAEFQHRFVDECVATFYCQQFLFDTRTFQTFFIGSFSSTLQFPWGSNISLSPLDVISSDQHVPHNSISKEFYKDRSFYLYDEYQPPFYSLLMFLIDRYHQHGMTEFHRRILSWLLRHLVVSHELEDG